jgi:hypothetical protein
MKSTHLDADRNHFLPGKKFEPHGKKSPPGAVMSESGRDGWPVTKGRDTVNIRSTTLTVGALFALSVPGANATVVLGDGAGAVSTTARTPAAAATLRHHAKLSHKATVKDAASLLPDNYYQVKRNLI